MNTSRQVAKCMKFPPLNAITLTERSELAKACDVALSIADLPAYWRDLVQEAIRNGDSSEKGGPGSGFHGHAGRPGKRGGSDNDGSTGSPTGGTPAAQRKPSATLSDRPVTRTQAIAVAIQKLDGGKPTGNLLASDAGKHFFALGFKGPVIKQLYDLSQMYKAGGAPRQKAIGAIMTALASDTELGDALRAQIDTEDELAKEKAKKAGVRPAKIGNLPTAGKQGGRGSGASEEEKRLAADRARAQRDHDQELADQIAAEKRKKGKESARWRKVGETVYLGTRPIVDATDHGDTVSSGEAVISWPEVVAGYHVLAGLAVSYGDPNGAITLLRRDALPKRGSAQKGGPGSGFHGHAGRPGERGGSRKEGNTPLRSVKPGTRKLTIGSTKLSGDVDRVEHFGLEAEGLAKIIDLGDGTRAKAIIRDTEGPLGLHVKGEWHDTTTNKKIGQFERYLYKNGKDAELVELAMEEKYIGKGKGVQAARQWLDGLAEAGYERAILLADMTIGAYAWAREGVKYAMPDEAEKVTAHFAKWVQTRRVPDLEDRLPTFKTPQDVATYKHPDGFVLASNEISNDDVKPNRVYDIGKAYMLDALGHGPYDAVFDLRNRRKTQ